MKFLVIASRFPWPSYTGDRLRATMWLDALSLEGEVKLVTSGSPGAGELAHLRNVELFSAAASPPRFLASSVRALREGIPYHALIAAGRAWPDAIRRAHREVGRFDAAVILLSRLEPWVQGRVSARRTILDAIDSLAESAAERARESSGVGRWFWQREIERMRGLEESLASRYDNVVVVSESERARFGPRTVAIPMGVEILPLAERGARRYAYGFWGRLGYFANADAANMLISQIWPAIRRAQPDAELLIAGADAPRSILRMDGRDGIVVQSPMSERPSLLRSIDIALFPVRYGTGQSLKLLEAAEAGCAIVGTPTALRGLSHLEQAAVMRETPEGIAAAAIELRNDRQRLEQLASAARHLVETHDSRESSLARMRSLATGGTV